jgi:hypothetical protein
MPYIKQDEREILLGSTLDKLCSSELSEGQVNYIISIILKRQFFANRCYREANKLVGAVECAKQEFIRRYLNAMEDEKIIQNGDI